MILISYCCCFVHFSIFWLVLRGPKGKENISLESVSPETLTFANTLHMASWTYTRQSLYNRENNIDVGDCPCQIHKSLNTHLSWTYIWLWEVRQQVPSPISLKWGSEHFWGWRTEITENLHMEHSLAR